MPQAGQQLDGKYLLEDLIGSGGMGTVWRARHQRLGRACAVKFLNSGESSALRTQRFVREAQIAASVQHPNVVSIFDFGQTPAGELFMVMELLPGQALSERLERGPPLSMHHLCELIAQALAGLGAIHERGIVHRDLKPENIFLVESAPEPAVKLLDFGISRAVFRGAGEDGRSLRTGPGFTMGTPHFMSPEQVRGAEHLDGRSDFYTLGVILYRAAAGRYPFEDEDLQRLFIRTATEDPVPVGKLRPELGRPLCDVIDRALARNPRDRFASAADFRAALLAARETAPPGLLSQWRPGAGDTESLAGPWGAGTASDAALASRRLSSDYFRMRWRRLVPLGVVALVIALGFLLLGR